MDHFVTAAEVDAVEGGFDAVAASLLDGEVVQLARRHAELAARAAEVQEEARTARSIAHLQHRLARFNADVEAGAVPRPTRLTLYTALTTC